MTKLRPFLRSASPCPARLQVAWPPRAIVTKQLREDARNATIKLPPAQLAVHLCKAGQCTSAWREWHALYKLDGSRSSLSASLMKTLMSASPPAEQAAAPPARTDQWSWRDKWKRLVKAVCDGEGLDADQRSVLRETSDLVYNNRTGFFS